MTKTRKIRNESFSKDSSMESETPARSFAYEPVLEELEPLEEPLDSVTRMRKIQHAYAQVCLHLSRTTLWVSRLVELSAYPNYQGHTDNLKTGRMFEPVMLSPEQVETILSHVRQIASGADAPREGAGAGADQTGVSGSSKGHLPGGRGSK